MVTKRYIFLEKQTHYKKKQKVIYVQILNFNDLYFVFNERLENTFLYAFLKGDGFSKLIILNKIFIIIFKILLPHY